jgi:hypothetical protein
MKYRKEGRKEGRNDLYIYAVVVLVGGWAGG